MTNKSLSPDKISDELIKLISEPDTVFVFPTDVVLNSWVDFLITHPELSGLSAVPMERFIAWDIFKGNYVKARQEDLTAIPSILRKLFVEDFIAKNASLPQEQRLQVIINPDDTMASNATSFADWLSSNLSSLHYWKKRIDQAQDYGELDSEDKDYLKLYESYRNFLQANSLFEPAWIEEINFGEDKKHFCIFYPELLEDFRDYEETFSKSDNITIFTMPQNISSPTVHFYSDSRKELRQTILKIIALNKKGLADFSEIALSVPGMDIYRPYLERELAQYGIPFVIKAGTSLTAGSAGKIFREINNCHQSDYSFDSLRSLLLDETVPWKDEIKQLKEDLIREGNRMRCVITIEKDIWKSSFDSKIGRLKTSIEKTQNEDRKKSYLETLEKLQELENFYNNLRGKVEFFYKENTFAHIDKAWQAFKNDFLKEDSDFDENANLIIGRCISELREIVAIEKQYSHCSLQIDNPFKFFLDIIDGKKYQPQTDTTGLTVYPYKLSAAASYKYQFVIDASQDNLDIPFKRLTFLNGEKRRKLHLIEEDKTIRASEAFINLYAKTFPDTEKEFVTFSAAEDTFSGFQIPHSSLNAVTEESQELQDEIQRLNRLDFILAEKNYLEKDGSLPAEITPHQKQQLLKWKASAIKEDDQYKINAKIRSNIDYLLNEKRRDSQNPSQHEDRYFITARGDLEKFFPCPRKWLLNSALRLSEDSLDTQLMQPYDMGNLNHKILEFFTEQFIDKKLPWYDQENDVFMLNDEEYKIDLIPIVEKAIISPSDFRDCPVVIKVLTMQKVQIAEKLISFLKTMLVPYASKTDSKGSQIFSGLGNCTVHSMEEYIVRSDEDKAFNYSGKIDLLLKTPSGQWMIIDYKNSSTSIPSVNPPDENDIIGDFQMPLYVRLVEKKGGSIPVAAFYSIKDGKNESAIDDLKTETVKDEKGKAITDDNGEPVRVQCKSQEQYERTLEVLDSYAELFDSTVKNGYFTPETSDSDKDRLNVKNYRDCIKCPYKKICRTTYTIGGKRIAKAQENK